MRASSAPQKAASGNAIADVTAMPEMNTITAPSTAPEATPTTLGSASELRNNPCINAPAIASPAPTNAATIVRGTRMSQTITSSARDTSFAENQKGNSFNPTTRNVAFNATSVLPIVMPARAEPSRSKITTPGKMIRLCSRGSSIQSLAQDIEKKPGKWRHRKKDIVFQHQHLTLPCRCCERDRRVFHETPQYRVGLTLRRAGDDPFRIPVQDLLRIDCLISAQPIFGANVRATGCAHDVVEERLASVAVTCHVTEDSWCDCAGRPVFFCALDCLLEFFVDALGSNLLACEISHQQNGPADFVQRRESGEQPEHRDPAIFHKVREVGPAGARDQKQIRIELENNFGIGCDRRTKLFDPLVNIAVAAVIRVLTDRNHALRRHHGVNEFVDRPALRTNRLHRTADLYPIAFGINGSPRIGRITRREIRSPIRADGSRDLERARIRLCEMQGDCHTCNHSKDTSSGHDAAPFRSLRKQTDASFSKRVRLMLGESEVIDGPSSPCLEGSNEKIRSSTGLRTCRHQPLPIPTGRCFPARFL